MAHCREDSWSEKLRRFGEHLPLITNLGKVKSMIQIHMWLISTLKSSALLPCPFPSHFHFLITSSLNKFRRLPAFNCVISFSTVLCDMFIVIKTRLIITYLYQKSSPESLSIWQVFSIGKVSWARHSKQSPSDSTSYSPDIDSVFSYVPDIKLFVRINHN